MSIKIKSLKVDSLAEKALKKDYLYKDVTFDLTPAISFNNQLNKKEYLKDIQPLYDIESVRNSIKTAFLTSPGDKILSPTYGVDLRQYLFEEVNIFTTFSIKEDIMSKLPKMEPRITLQGVTVQADPDNNLYRIELQIDVPSLNIYGLSIKSELNSVGYSIL